MFQTPKSNLSMVWFLEKWPRTMKLFGKGRFCWANELWGCTGHLWEPWAAGTKPQEEQQQLYSCFCRGDFQLCPRASSKGISTAPTQLKVMRRCRLMLLSSSWEPVDESWDKRWTNIYIWNKLVPPGKLSLRQKWEKDWRKVPEVIKEKKPKATTHNLENPYLESKGGFQREQQFSCPQTDKAVLTDDPRAKSQGLQFCSP